MIKNIGLMKRRADLSRSEFRRHYEECHVPLGLAWFAFDKYVRNHVGDDQPDPGFDCIAEFWPRDLAQIERAFAAAAKLFEEDDAKFIGPGRRGGRVEETLLAGPARAVDPPGTVKRLDLLRRSTLPGVKALGDWASAEVAASRADRITIDLPVEGLGNLGDVALLHRWGAADGTPAPGERLATALAEVFETGAAILAAPEQDPPRRTSGEGVCR